MKNISENRACFLKKDGSWEYYPYVVSKQHQELIEDFCKKQGYEYPSVGTIIKEGNAVFLSGNNGLVVSYLPRSLSEKQYIELDIMSSIHMDDLTYLEVYKEGEKKSFILTDNIGREFSDQVLQSYFKESSEKKIK